jgi:hypothetical protein
MLRYMLDTNICKAAYILHAPKNVTVGTASHRSRTEDDPPGLACFTVRSGGDFHILIEHGEHAHQSFHGKALVVAPQNVREVGLLDADQLGGGDLRQLPGLDEPVKLHDQGGLELMFLGVGKAEVSKDIAASDLVGGQGLLAHNLAPSVAL